MSSSNYFRSWIDRPHLDPNKRLLTEEYQRGITEFMGLVHRQPEAKTAANRVISELRADNQANRTHIRSIAGMFDVLAETNPALAAMWQNVRPTINPDPTPEEQADL
ncbi:hypothetical protein F2Q69_00035887 [Brassica cretica]|uniref:Uncharacterized protein n=1 Tax=Brassica cretica TaxID=69181 RepID=A0A8S9SSU2_BRACR|nr:hypothetical protein F2Q69_00035887 [Brassica cretica]